MKKKTLNKLIQDLSAISFKGINNKDKDENTILHYVAEYSNAETIKLLIEKGANVNSRNKEEQTPLHLATYKKRVRNVQVLVKARADVNAMDYKNSTPLHIAALSGSESIVRILIKAGSKVNAIDSLSCSPLFYGRHNEKIRKLIEEKGGKMISKLGKCIEDLISQSENVQMERFWSEDKKRNGSEENANRDELKDSSDEDPTNKTYH